MKTCRAKLELSLHAPLENHRAVVSEHQALTHKPISEGEAHELIYLISHLGNKQLRPADVVWEIYGKSPRFIALSLHMFNACREGHESRILSVWEKLDNDCLLYTSPSPRDATLSRMPSSA